MNLQAIAEWCGYTVTNIYRGVVMIEREDGPDGYQGAFNPLGLWSDCGPVLAKLFVKGSMQRLSDGRLLWTEHGRGLKGMAITSKTRVTDDATLRRAVVEIAEQVCKEGA